jgi:hypothetical protein
MKKLLTLLFTLAVAFSFSMPAFSQEAGAAPEKKEETGKMEKKSKKKGAKKSKKEKKMEEKKEGEGAAPQK